MNIPDNKMEPITWEMITEKLDEEMQGIKSHSPPDTDAALLSYFKVATAYIHRCLIEHKVPADLYDAVYKREKILGHIAHRWMDEAVRRGGNTMDKEGVAAISLENWLKQVRREEQEASLERLCLNERTLIYSEVELTADGKKTTFLIGGIPDTFTIDGIDDYQDFIAYLPPLTEIEVSVSSWSVGCGESEDAYGSELSLIVSNKDFLEQVFGIDHLQTEHFTEFAPDTDNSTDYEEELDDGLEL